MGTYIAGLPPHTQIYLSADAPNHPNMLLHSRLRTAGDDVRGYNGWRCFVYPTATRRDTTYVLSEENSVSRLQAYFPSGALQTEGLSNAYGYEDYLCRLSYPGGRNGRLRDRRTCWMPPGATRSSCWAMTCRRKKSRRATKCSSPSTGRRCRRWRRAIRLCAPAGRGKPGQRAAPVGAEDSEPCHGFYPTAVWREGEIIRDEIQLRRGRPMRPPGVYDLAVGFYTWPDFQRLSVGDTDSFVLRQITVRE